MRRKLEYTMVIFFVAFILQILSPKDIAYAYYRFEESEKIMFAGDTYKLDLYDVYVDEDHEWEEDYISDGEMDEKNAHWSSTNTNVATVDRHGNITAIAPGNSRIKCQIEEKSASFDVVVVHKGLRKKITLQCTEQQLLTCYGYEDVTWSTSNPKIVKVSKNGKITGVKPGIAQISACSGENKLVCQVIVIKANKLEYSDKKVSKQKIWEKGDTVYATKLLNMLKANKNGTTYTFPDEISYERALNYYKAITADDKFSMRNRVFDNLNGSYTVEIVSCADNTKYMTGKKGTLKNFKKVYSAIENAGVKNGIDVKTAYKKIEKYILNKNQYDYTYQHFSFSCVLNHRKSVCQGYSELTMLMCVSSGIDCNMTISYSGNHAWNRVKLNGKWYYTDITFIDTAKSNKYSLSIKNWTDHAHKEISTMQYFRTSSKYGMMEVDLAREDS